jgi:hypothetical protein
MNILKHLWTIMRHRFWVRHYCFRLGLFRQGLFHDISKYSPIEFWTSVKYYQGSSSPIDAEVKEKGYSLVWQHHKGHNPHHWEYWITNLSSYENMPIKIPYNYVLEMICDWISSGKVYAKNSGKTWSQSDPYKFYKNVKLKNHDIILHEETKCLVEYFLSIIRYYGVDNFIRVARNKNYSLIQRNY